MEKKENRAIIFSDVEWKMMMTNDSETSNVWLFMRIFNYHLCSWKILSLIMFVQKKKFFFFIKMQPVQICILDRVWVKLMIDDD